ncbi:MAG: TonB-dependent receptor, partial [Telluria sp.]
MINHNRLQLTKLAFALSMALAISTPVLAQNTTSAIGGRISNASGAPVAGAQVTIVHMESGSVSKVVADSQGRYSARGLRVGGPYTITITKDGVAEKFENVFLQLAETANVDATLGAPAIQTVTIAGRAAGGKFNTSSMGAGTTVGSRELAALGSVQRSLSDYARLDPRLSQTDKERGEISAGGQNARFNSITIDGVSISDTFGLEGNGLPTNKQPISIDSIQSVQVNISNYDVTQKGYTGANINAVTKSGTNTWKGSVYRVYRDDRLTGDRYNPVDNTYSEPAEFKEKTNGFTLGGPLIKDKLFMFVSAEDFASSRTAPAFGPLGSSANNVAITQSSIAELQRIARTQYGFDPGTTDIPAGIEQTVADRLIKLDWNVNDDHRVNLRWQKTTQKEPIISGYSNSGIGLSSQNYNETKKIESTVAQWFADWTPTFSTEAKVSRRDSGRSYVNSNNLPAMSLRISGVLPPDAPAGTRTGDRFINFGTERSRHFNELDTKTIDMYTGATWVLGAHEIKGGADYAKNSMFNAFLQNTKGNYLFGCINSSASVTYNTIVGPVVCASSPQATVEKAALENFSRGRLINYLLQVPVAGVTLNDTAAIWELANTGLFLQDTWTVSPQLKLNFGVRYDQYSTDDRPRTNAKVATARVPGVYSATSIVRDSGGFGLDNTETIDGDSLVQPRMGFNYTFASARPTQVRGGVGLFGGAALNVWLGNPFANPGVSTTTVGCGTSGFAAC